MHPTYVLSNDHWVMLEHDVREALKQNSVEDHLWLVHDLLTVVRQRLDLAGLTTWNVAQKYFDMFPDDAGAPTITTTPPTISPLIAQAKQPASAPSSATVPRGPRKMPGPMAVIVSPPL